MGDRRIDSDGGNRRTGVAGACLLPLRGWSSGETARGRVTAGEAAGLRGGRRRGASREGKGAAAARACGLPGEGKSRGDCFAQAGMGWANSGPSPSYGPKSLFLFPLLITFSQKKKRDQKSSFFSLYLSNTFRLNQQSKSHVYGVGTFFFAMKQSNILIIEKKSTFSTNTL